MPDAIASQIVALALKGRLDAGASAMDLLDAAFEGSHGGRPDFRDSSQRFGGALDPREPFGQLIVQAFDRGMEPQDWLGLLREDVDPRARRALMQLYESEVLQAFAGRYLLWGAAACREEPPRHPHLLRAL